MSWLIIALLSYFILAVVFLVDKHLLTERIPDPKLYAFYGGFFSILILLLIPFVGLDILSAELILLALFTGALFVLALFWFYKALKQFEASRVVPAVGSISPIFTLLLIYAFSLGQEVFSSTEFLGFLLLIVGSFFITYKESDKISLTAFKVSVFCSFLFALYFVFLKYVYLTHGFWNGLIWTRTGCFLMAMVFLVQSPEIREEIFKKRFTFKKKTIGIFGLSRMAGVAGGFLQNLAIFLAPLTGVAVINALQGSQYAFLFILALFFSFKYPHILKEEVSKEAVFQKLFAIIIIGVGLVFLALFGNNL